MKLLVRNLSRNTNTTTLKTLFEALGTVKSCTIVMDQETNASKGFGFVEMPNPGDAKAAVKTLNGSKVDGAIIRVKRAAHRAKGSEKSTPS